MIDNQSAPGSTGPAPAAARYAWRGVLARNTVWMAFGQGGRVALGAAYFVIIARVLGADGYGAFVGTVALVALVSPFASIGAGNLLVKYVARSPHHFRRYWGGALSITLLSGVVLAIAVILSARIFLPSTIPLSLVVCVAVGDLIFARVIDISGQAFQAHERLSRTAQFPVIMSLLRLAAAGMLVLVGHPNAARWAAWYLASSGIGALVTVAIAWRELGGPALVFGYPAADFREGVYFATSLSAQSVYNDIDKSMLARLSTLEATGIYGAAYRILEVAFVPVRALLSAAYPRFFRHGERGARASLAISRRLLPFAGGYAAVAGIVLYLAAPLLPHLLGEDFRASVSAVRILAVLPLLKTIHYFAADALSGAGYQGRRTLVQVVIAVFNVGVNVPLILWASWRGAAWSSIASDGLLAVLLWWTLLAMCRREDRAPRDGTPLPAMAMAGGAS
jgi:O-antigen/teichoic acid export membrane protein